MLGKARNGEGNRPWSAGAGAGSAPLASSARCAPREPFNLLAAMALWVELRIDPAGLHAEVLVVAARPELRAPRLWLPPATG
jgi:hypothetical protein